MANINYAAVTESILSQLQEICGPQHVVFEDQNVLQKYSRDQVPEDKDARLPEVVVKPKTAEQVAAIMRLANREKAPLC